MKLSLATLIACVFSVALLARPAYGAGPPNGVYTCSWIAQHPVEAAQALVSCDPEGPVQVPGVRPFGGDMPDAQGCQFVPNGGGAVGQWVYAWSQYEYANYWSWGPAVIQQFHWYIQKTNGDIVRHSVGIGSGSTTVGANVLRWGAQNQGPEPQTWYVCYAVV